jgi:hypothetical protein
MKNLKLAIAALAIIATVGSAFTPKKLTSYWFKASDDSSLGTSTNHQSEPATIIAYLESTVQNLDFNNTQTGSLYANGFAIDSPAGTPQDFIYSTPQP